MVIVYVGLLLVLFFRHQRSPFFRPGFALWLLYSVINLGAWWFASESTAMPILSLLYPGFFALASAEAVWSVARGYEAGEVLRISIFALAAAYVAILAASLMPTQWNLFIDEAGLQSITAQAYLGLGTALLTSLILLWRFGRGRRTIEESWIREAWIHAWLFVVMLAIKVSAFAYPAMTSAEWRTKSLINFVGMSAVLFAWCFLLRPSHPQVSQSGLRAA